jgi:2-aminoadipate transaminase
MVIGKQSVDVHSPSLNQAIVDAYLRKGLMPGHLERICGDYRNQLNAMLDGFKHFPEGTKHTLPEGGLFVWAELPEGTDAMKVFEAAVEANVAFVPGTHFYTEGGHMNTMRLNFSMCDIPTIQAGMERLGTVIKKELK